MSYATVPHLIRPRAVARHLSRVALDGGAACMTSSYLRVPGTVEWDSHDSGLIFQGRPTTLSRVARIEKGQSVRVDYRHNTDRLVFFSRITDALEEGSWRLSRPQTVQRLTRRDGIRHPMTPTSGVRMAMMTNDGIQAFPIADLSSGGAAIQYDARQLGLWVGRRITVWLETTEVKGVAITAEVRHVSRRGCAPGHKLAGVRFVDPGLEARQAIEQTLFDR